VSGENRPALRAFHTATPAFSAGTDTPREFLERCIAVIEADQPKFLAFVTLDLADARNAADAATKRWKNGAPLSPIDGLPVGIKYIIETANMPTQMGSPLFAGYRSGRDAASVAALREAGAVVVGKTVTTEFAATVARETRNPWDPTRTPGGSSSGSACAVGDGMLPAALGTQVIGSILRPAAYCGAFGYKPSVGGINRGGSVDYHSQSCQGVIAATLEDAWFTAREISARGRRSRLSGHSRPAHGPGGAQTRAPGAAANGGLGRCHERRERPAPNGFGTFSARRNRDRRSHERRRHRAG
jgi:Asp-tRNA(Asn)/Glu-tRNA(Gln) amidotransferase A subunit family amidase